MTPFQSSLAKESAVVGVNVAFDTVVHLPSGRSVTAHAHFPDFGAQNGTLVFHSFEEYRDAEEELLACGYAYSEYGNSQDSYFDPDSLREMLSEWGWVNKKAAAPWWVKQPGNRSAE